MAGEGGGGQTRHKPHLLQARSAISTAGEERADAVKNSTTQITSSIMCISYWDNFRCGHSSFAESERCLEFCSTYETVFRPALSLCNDCLDRRIVTHEYEVRTAGARIRAATDALGTLGQPPDASATPEQQDQQRDEEDQRVFRWGMAVFQQLGCYRLIAELLMHQRPGYITTFLARRALTTQQALLRYIQPGAGRLPENLPDFFFIAAQSYWDDFNELLNR